MIRRGFLWLFAPRNRRWPVLMLFAQAQAEQLVERRKEITREYVRENLFSPYIMTDCGR